MLTTYKSHALQISLETTSPAALHQSLVQSIINTLIYQMQSGMPIPKNVQESNVYLLQLLESLQPDERQLELINNHVDIAQVRK